MTYYKNGYRVTVEIDYEALGRYVAAKEQAEEYLRERDTHLTALRQLLNICQETGAAHAPGALEVVPAETLWSQSKEANENLLRAIERANQVAEKCGKAKLSMFKL